MDHKCKETEEIKEMDAKAFQKSINDELLIVKDRVRKLIGTAHWGEDGRHKESVLKNVIERFLPNNISIGTGFVISKRVEDFKQTTQIDIILYDNNYPVLFSDGDFIITTPKNVVGIIEVKTKIRNSDFNEIIKKSVENGKLIGSEYNKIFNGIFSYEYSESLFDNRTSDNNLSEIINNSLKESNGVVNHISFGQDWFIKYWFNENDSIINDGCKTNNFYNIYKLKDLSFSYFISNLIEKVSPKDSTDRFWFMYPIEGTKEIQREKTICLDGFSQNTRQKMEENK